MLAIVAAGEDPARQALDRNKKEIRYENWAQFTGCMSEINNMQVEIAKDFHVDMLMYNISEYSDDYSKISKSLWQYCKNKPNDYALGFESFKFKPKITDDINAVQETFGVH